MLISFLAVLIMYLVIIGYISSQTSNTVGNLKLNEMAAKTKFAEEKILFNSISLYTEKNGILPTDVQLLKSNNYLNENFNNSSSYIFSLANNNTTLVICSNFENNNENYKNFYLKHYKGKEYGYSPYLDTTNTRNVCHPFPLRIETIDILK